MKLKRVLIIGVPILAILLAVAIVFVISTSGFKNCIQPSSLEIASLDIGQDSVHISGRIANSLNTYEGHKVKLKNGVMYLGIKVGNCVFSDNSAKFDFEIDIPDDKSVTKIILKGNDEEKVIFENGEVKNILGM